MWIMREKSLSVHGDYGKFRMGLYIQSHFPTRQKYLSVHGEYKRIWRIREVYFAVYGEYVRQST
jgi:hypothetical protein